MGCNCKNTNTELENSSSFNKSTKLLGNIGIRIFLFVIGAVIIPLTIPFMWYFLFNKLFFESKSLDLAPSLLALSKRFLGRSKTHDNFDDDDLDFDPNELELITQIEEE